MTTTLHALSGNVADLLAEPVDPRHTIAWVETNAESGAIVDTTSGGKILVGSPRIDIADDGSFSVALPTTAGATIPTGFQYRVWVEYRTVFGGAVKKARWTSGWFSLTAPADLKDVVEESYVPPTYATQLADSLDAHAADLESAITQAALGDEDALLAAAVTGPATATRTALNTAYARERARNVADFGLATDGLSVALQAAHDDMAGGGVIVIPEGTHDATGTAGVTITKPVEIRGATPSYEGSPTRLRFPAGSKGITVQLANSGEGFRVRDLAIIGQAAGAEAGNHGLHLKFGRTYLERVTVSGFGGHGAFYDGTGANNVNHGEAVGLRCYENRGDGIRAEGSNANALTLIAPDCVGNYGWGVNNMGGHNLFLHPHFDQQYHASPGCARDNGLSNRWEMVYEENLSSFLVDTGSQDGYVSVSTFGLPTIATSGIAHTTWEIVRKGGSRNRLRTSNGTKQFQMGVGLIGTNTFDLASETDSFNIFSVAANGSETAWWGHQMPAADASYDFGWAGAQWRNAYLSGMLRLGGLWLRNNAGTLEKSTDGSTWSAV